MILSLIVATSQNGVIGKDNKIPWHLSEDLKRFKALTMNHPIIMGRKTFDSLGRLLPGRPHIVITRDKNWKFEGVHVAHSFDEALKFFPHDENFVIGGAEIYKLAQPLADKIYWTQIKKDFEGDAFFKPDISGMSVIEKSDEIISEKENLPYVFVTYSKG